MAKKRPDPGSPEYYTDPRTPLWPHSIGIVLALSLCGYGFYRLASSMGIGAESTEGKVVRIEEWRDADRTTYTTVATYTVDGHTYRCEYNAQHDLWTYYQVGDRVQIFYQVDDPSSAVFDSSLSRLFSILFIALGFILGTYFIRILVRHIRNIRAAARKKSPSG